ncbi:glycosyltransferase family 4 protein [Acidobacteria bacterium AB60]|nr:glycosyltransferase family 4 protein [Acidobacteria bacterium AB60]
MPMTVLSLAYPFAVVGPNSVGGAEQILTELDQGLVKAGHRSLVIACMGSSATGKLLALPAFNYRTEVERERLWRRAHVEHAVSEALAANDVDLIHVHDLNFHEYRLPYEVPVLVTLHMPISWYPADVWRRLPANVMLQCVSDSQRRTLPPHLKDVAIIPNGVELHDTVEERRDFALVLGRICPEKNQHEALEAGFQAATPVVIGGKVFPWKAHTDYFHERLMPLLNEARGGVQHRYCGPLPEGRKRRLLAQAKCLLHPTLAPETSSLVGMEALAAGTPVIAYRSGALPEIVDDGVTGFLVSNAGEMAEAIKQLGKIRHEDCRAAAEERFSRERMVRQYLSLYAGILRNRVPETMHA